MIFYFAQLLAVGLAAFGVSWFLTETVRRRLVARAIMDIPNERSMHKAPVPRGGGLAVMAVIMGGMAAFGAFLLLRPEPQFPLAYVFLLPALFLLVGVSWLDDKHGLGAGVRLSVHLLAALIGSFALNPDFTLFHEALPFWLDRAVMIVGWAWLMNLTNFMDGIDGITGAETICVAFGATVPLSLLLLAIWGFPAEGVGTGLTLDLHLAAFMIGACGGFLMLNKHPAKIFLGDVGSVPLGFLMGYLLLQLWRSGGPAPALILPLYYLADSGITIVHRAIKGEKIWLPHRQHFYQRAAAGVGSHSRVVGWICLENAVLILLSATAFAFPWISLAAAMGTVALLLIKMHKSGKKALP